MHLFYLYLYYVIVIYIIFQKIILKHSRSVFSREMNLKDFGNFYSYLRL